MTFHAPHHFRVRTGQLASDDRSGNHGLFVLPNGLRVVSSDGAGWEHASVSFTDWTPSWRDMCHVKSLWWDPEDAVMQLHPPESTYINNHPHCLHLWRPTGLAIPLPPSNLVGIPGGPLVKG